MQLLKWQEKNLNNNFKFKRKRALIGPEWWLSFTKNDIVNLHTLLSVYSHYKQISKLSHREESYLPGFIQVVNHLVLCLSPLQILPLPLSTPALIVTLMSLETASMIPPLELCTAIPTAWNANSLGFHIALCLFFQISDFFLLF